MVVLDLDIKASVLFPFCSYRKRIHIMADSATRYNKSRHEQGTPHTSDFYRHVVKRMAHKWEELCILLEFDKDGAKCAAIRRDFSHLGVESCCFQVFHHWVRGEGKQPVQWRTIITCLQDMECHAIVRDLRKFLQAGKFLFLFFF